MLSFLWKKPQSVNIKPLENRVQVIENKIQQLEGSNTQLVAQMQQLETVNTQLTNQIQQLTNQIQTLTNSIQPVLNDYRNFAKKNERNKFQELQEIQYPDEALSFIQDNNANYIHFKRSDGIRRGYLGIGASNTKVMDVNGAEGVRVIAETGDLELNPKNGAINANNKPVKNIADPTTPNDAINWDYLTRRIKTIEGTWNSNNPGYKVWPNIRGGLQEIINFECWYEYQNQLVPGKAYGFKVLENGNKLGFWTTYLQGDIPPSQFFKVKVKMTYITLR